MLPLLFSFAVHSLEANKKVDKRVVREENIRRNRDREGVRSMEKNIKIIGLGFVNAFLIKAGDGFVLIDSGLTRQWKELDKALLSAGCKAGDIRLLVLTHGDLDHAGNCVNLKEKYGVPVAMHKGDSATVMCGTPGKRTIRSFMFKIVFLLSRLVHRGAPFPLFTPDILLEDGQSLDEYGLSALVIHIPGHTKGSIGLLTDEGDLFVGDTLVNTKRPDISPFVENFHEYRASLDRLKGMSIRTVYSGHGAPFPGSVIASISMPDDE
jgi:hydroxyacylglutathione hydrolase